MSNCYNPYIILSKLFGSLLCYIFLKNSILQLIIASFLFSTAEEKNHYIFAKITLFCTLFNTFCGKLTIFCNILLFIYTFLWIISKIRFYDLLCYLNYFVKNQKAKQLISTKLCFCKLLIITTKTKKQNIKEKIIYFFNNYSKLYYMLKEDAKQMEILLKRRQFYNLKSNPISIKTTKVDFISLFLIIALLNIIILIGRSNYALFN